MFMVYAASFFKLYFLIDLKINYCVYVVESIRDIISIARIITIISGPCVYMCIGLFCYNFKLSMLLSLTPMLKVS